ncbi:phage holin family protein [uncultured Methanobacterium sp.]|uniref:phage holin family protein n=1 Tax=uncultured Methanobacterium sp. TaxID=176306 RepID=UPI002AA8F0DB|nr:phage holin family protein [uncultured Methanobacterium sp.]
MEDKEKQSIDWYDQVQGHSRFYWLARTLVMWLGGFLGFMFIDYLSIGLYFNDWVTALIAAGVVGILNALFWPLLARILLPFMVFTVGIGALLLNAFLIWLASELITGFTIQGPALILAPIAMAAVTAVLSAILTIDDDATYYRNVIRKIKKGKIKFNEKPGVIFLEIDGLAFPILKEAIKNGTMPTLKKWLENNSHGVIPWETDLSSQTGASQAGILHGNNQDIPAFRWVEKDKNNKIMVSTGLSDAPVIEKRISDGNGLLACHGASRTNLFSGDAVDVIFTYSQLKNLGRFYTRAWYYVYSYPSNFARIVALFLWDVILDFASQLVHWIKNIQPRIKRGFIYPFVRAGANVFLREVTTAVVIGDMLEGKVDVAYVTYLGYDEIAHHSGTRDWDAFYALKKLDIQFHRLDNARKYAPRPYHLVVQSDHGQTNGATFLQRYGQSLEDLVRDLMPPETLIYSELSSNEDHFGQAFQSPIEDSKRYIRDRSDHVVDESRYLFDTAVKKVDEAPVIKGKVLDYLQRHDIGDIPPKKQISSENAQVIVLASGNLGLIYLTEHVERLTFEQIKATYPDLIPGLVQHQGVGFVMVKSKEQGPMAVGKDGIHYLKDGTIEGEDPLTPFGPRAFKHLLRTDGFRYAPDILVNSFYDPETNEVAAFEELVGSHGGLGGEQTQPFILYPSQWDMGSEEIVGAENLHRVLKKHLKHLQ